MAIKVSSKKTASFVYDFTVNGGAVSTIAMGVFIPVNAIIWFGYAKVITTFTSGGAAAVAISFRSGLGSLASNLAANYTANVIDPGTDLLATPVVSTTINELAITIAIAALTAGKLVYTCVYTEWNE